jgi:MATE family multidrug resistance protein
MSAITHRRIWAISWPIILSNATIPILGAVDTAVVGQMGQAAPIGAVGMGAIVLASVYWIFGFLRMGTSGLAAQAHGAGDREERAAILYRALTIGLGAGLVIFLAQGLLVAAAFWLAPASAAVESLARDYLAIRIWGAPATIALYAVTGWLIATERTRAVLWLTLWINGVNAGLDLWFVLGLGWGVEGVAAATLAAEWSGLFLGLWLCRDAFGPLWRGALARLWARDPIRRMLAVNGGIMLRTVLLQGAFTAFLFLSAGQGDAALAANQVLMQFLSITAYALDGFAFAAETLVGQAVGARARAEVQRAAGLCMAWGAAGAVVLGGAFGLFGPAIIDLMTTAPEVRAEARTYLPWVALAPLIGVASWMYDGIFIGATLARAMVQVVAVAVLAYGAAILLLMPVFGTHGLWAALMVLNATRGLAAALMWPGLRARLWPAAPGPVSAG